MRSYWHALHAHFLGAVSTHTTHIHFRHLRRDHAAIEPFRDPPGLLSVLHDRGGDPDRKNAILAALVRAAQADHRTADTALKLLTIALWPGLDAIHRRNLRHFRDEPAELVSGITARFVEQIRCLSLDRVTRIAATILRNVERDLRRQLSAEWRRAGLTGPIEDLDAAPPVTPLVSDGSDGAPDAACRRARALVGPVVPRDAALVVNVAVVGLTQAEAAARHGIGPACARKRYQRALATLRSALVE